MPVPDHEKDELDLGEAGSGPVTEGEAQAEQLAHIAEVQERNLMALEQLAFCFRFYMEKTFPDFEEAFDSEFPPEDEDDDDAPAPGN